MDFVSGSAALADKQETKMKMSRAEHRSLSRFMERLRPTRQCMDTLKAQFPHLPPSTLLSIFSQEYQRTKRSCARHHAPDVVKGYYQRYRSEARTRPTDPVLLELANQVDLSPALLARVILECFLQECEPSVSASRLVLNNMLREPHLIPDLLLAKHVEQCTVNDCCYGPLVDCIKHAIGLEHEDILRDKLRERNLSFLDENQLRAKGYDKTPDIILEVPIDVVFLHSCGWPRRSLDREQGFVWRRPQPSRLPERAVLELLQQVRAGSGHLLVRVFIGSGLPARARDPAEGRLPLRHRDPVSRADPVWSRKPIQLSCGARERPNICPELPVNSSDGCGAAGNAGRLHVHSVCVCVCVCSAVIKLSSSYIVFIY
ncbi:CDAN1-interacting nuclease 1 isoform X3 [Pimephales promelas]|uniref:CDAN1-interacting nuclease 1 isoform X3 n=2 Tax=Pimephales promelas TaxID=90988 RepID=UPI0019555DC9|nr:CDAN1-interacting nuclease 1 isoform X3 [Pimephales promelas]